VSYVDSNIFTGDEEGPQDIQLGEAFVSSVVHAVMNGPGWSKTLLIWTYDEHGGYYDHVPPPRAVAPDNIAPRITVPRTNREAMTGMAFGFRPLSYPPMGAATLCRTQLRPHLDPQDHRA